MRKPINLSHGLGTLYITDDFGRTHELKGIADVEYTESREEVGVLGYPTVPLVTACTKSATLTGTIPSRYRHRLRCLVDPLYAEVCRKSAHVRRWWRK